MDIIDELERIKSGLDAIKSQMEHEEWIFKQELKERLDMNLQGEEAIEHYNKWMRLGGLYHLMIKE